MRNISLDSKRKLKGYLFILLGTAIILVTKFYPMIQAFLLSLRSGVGMNMDFAGLANYKRLFKDSLFRTALLNTVIYLIQIPIMLILALILAGILNRPNLKFKGIYRTLIFLPCVTAGVSYSMVFRSLFGSTGLINKVLMNIGLVQSAVPWLSSPWLARLVVLLAMTWRWTGYNTIFYLAGMQTISPSLYEAADLDGASRWKKLTSITVPSLRPVILLTVINSINGTLQLFTETRTITFYGPGDATLTLSNYIYRLTFEYLPQYGYAAAISYVVFIMVAVLALIQLKMGDKR